MKFFLDSIGCRLNQAEIERYAAQIRRAGHDIVESADEADWVVINTCSVTAEAASDSRQKIRHASRSGNPRLAVTGCWVTLEGGLAGSLPGVALIVSNENKENLIAEILGPLEVFEFEPFQRKPLPGIHRRTRAFIKCQDGCDQHCTYCITRLARGASRSLPVNDILSDIKAAVAGGTHEAVLTGVQLGGWGKDLAPSQSLPNLISQILEKTTIDRLRLSSLEPWELSDAYLPLWENSRFCPHLHLPLQSGCAKTLKHMGRKISPSQFSDWVERMRSVVPEIAITTDIIAGFPGETDTDFQESLRFIRAQAFSGGHVFTFSPRPGTPAALYPNQVEMSIRKERSAEIRLALEESSRAFRMGFLGKELSVLWESSEPSGVNKWKITGHSLNFIRVSACSEVPLWNSINSVIITSYDENGLLGKIKSKSRLDF